MSPYLNDRRSGGVRVCFDLGTAMSKASVCLGDSEVAPVPIGAAASAEHPLLTPSAMYVDDGRIFFGPSALSRAGGGVASKRTPIVSFKLVLSAREIEPTLALKLSRAVDPTSTLRHRDALVLYLAYLDQLLRAALAAEPGLPQSAADAPRRLTSPEWDSFGEAVRVVSVLADEAAAVSAQLGAALVSAVGLPVDVAREALVRAETSPARGGFEGIVLEAHSAAAAYANFAAASAPFFWVVDMGAGTTDMAGFERGPAVSDLQEIEAARQCCVLAGDELDNLLVDILVRASGERKLPAEDQLWRSLRLSIKDLKCDLFQTGKCSFKHGRKTVRVRRDAVIKHRSFKAYQRALVASFADSLSPLLARAKTAKAHTVTILLAGGGSNLPFLADLVRAAAKRCKWRGRLNIERFGATWSLPHQHHPFAGVFPQMAIVVGGALAPVVSVGAPAAELA